MAGKPTAKGAGKGKGTTKSKPTAKIEKRKAELGDDELKKVSGGGAKPSDFH